MSDIHGALSLIRGTDVPIARAEVTLIDESYGLPSRTDALHVGTAVRGITIRHNCKVSNPNLFDLWRYGLTDPLSLAWELTTLSFVMDWFTGVGAFLGSLSGPLGVSFSDGYETSWLRNQWDVTTDISRNSSTFEREVLVKGDRRATVNCKAMTRRVAYDPGIAWPYLALGLNVDQALSLIALLVVRR